MNAFGSGTYTMLFDLTGFQRQKSLPLFLFVMWIFYIYIHGNIFNLQFDNVQFAIFKCVQVKFTWLFLSWKRICDHLWSLPFWLWTFSLIFFFSEFSTFRTRWRRTFTTRIVIFFPRIFIPSIELLAIQQRKISGIIPNWNGKYTYLQCVLFFFQANLSQCSSQQLVNVMINANRHLNKFCTICTRQTFSIYIQMEGGVEFYYDHWPHNLNICIW